MKQYKIFADINFVDPAAMSQFYDAMKLNYTEQGAVMPDIHKGYALPIGSVVKTKDVVVPAWVGYDIGCTDKDTEFLTSTGWKKISEYQDGDKVLEYDLDNRQSRFAKPLRYIKKPCDEFNYLDNGVVNQMINDEHTMLLFSSKNIKKTVSASAESLISKNKQLSKGVNQLIDCTIPDIFNDDIDLTDDEIRLRIAISADGCIRNENIIEFHFKKTRKIERLRELCKLLDIHIKEYTLSSGNYCCTIKCKYTKDLNFLWKASKRQLKIVTEECVFWDGHDKGDKCTVTYSTTIKEHADIIQYAFAASGIRSNIQKTVYEKENWNDAYTVYTTKNPMVIFPKPKDISRVKSEDGYCYCFTTNTGYWVMRRNGKITITGNCGMSAVKTTFPKSDIDEHRDEIAKAIYEIVPVGFTHNEKPVKWADGDIPRTPVLDKIMKEGGYTHLGTLGGGNHFIEIGYDENDSIWIVVHSGSRGVGHKCATHYMNVACTGQNKEWHYPLDVNSEDGQDYITDLNYCLEFALENRKVMVERTINAISKFVKGRPLNMSFINRNHNHAESKDGKSWIHRKGATHAEEGMMGVIPGNMRDGSFIVRGKGNPESLCSSSHGAGRVMGRGEAKRQLTMAQFEDTMKGIAAKVQESTLDESPMAYKDIFEVMEMQKDLVDIVAHVKPIVNVKA